jgi:hypothetical protein
MQAVVMVLLRRLLVNHVMMGIPVIQILVSIAVHEQVVVMVFSMELKCVNLVTLPV